MAFAPSLNIAERALSEPTGSSNVEMSHIIVEEQAEASSPVVTDKASQREDQPNVANDQSDNGNIEPGSDGRYQESDDNSDDEMIEDKIENYPEGIPRLAAFLNSVESFTVFRRFGRIRCRILIHLELEVCELVKELDDLDRNDSSDPVNQERIRLAGADRFPDMRQRDLLLKIMEKLYQYDDLLFKTSKLLGLSCTSARDYKSVGKWMEKQRPILEEQQGFFHNPADFVSLAPDHKQKTWFQEGIEAVAERSPMLQAFLDTSSDRIRSDDKHILFYSPWKLKLLERILYVLIVAALLLVPIILMAVLPFTKRMMAVMISCFVLIFEVTICIVTDARPQDIFIGTAAYGAMLVAFLGNFN